MSGTKFSSARGPVTVTLGRICTPWRATTCLGWPRASSAPAGRTRPPTTCPRTPGSSSARPSASSAAGPTTPRRPPCSAPGSAGRPPSWPNYRRDNRAKKRATPPGTVRLGGADGSSDGMVAVDPPAGDPTPSYYERLTERRAAVERALGRLPDAVDRQIAALHLLQDCPLRQIADKLGVTYDQARSRMADIKRR